VIRCFLAVSACALSFAALAATARGENEYPKLNVVASVFAMKPVRIVCPTHDEQKIDPIWQVAWGYTFAGIDVAWIDTNLCNAALNVNGRSRPAWMRAIAILVLVHESYHMRDVSWNGNEAKVECAAIRHWGYAAKMLGATEETVKELEGWAQAFHWRLVTRIPAYYLPGCKVPWVY